MLGKTLTHNMVEEKKKLEEDIINFFGVNNGQEEEAFDFDYQNKFIKIFIEDKEFSEQLIDIIDLNFFESYQKVLINYIIKFVNKYGFNYDYLELETYIRDKENGISYEHLSSLISQIKNTSINRQRTKDRALEYFKKQSLKNALIESITKWKKKDYESISTTISDALKKGEPKSSGHDYFIDSDKRLMRHYRSPIPIMNGLDSYFEGGLSGGELGIVMAPPGGGKSMCLVKFACTAIQAGKKVLYYTLELSESNVGQRFDASLNNIRLKDVWEFPDLIKENAKRLYDNGGHLIIKEYPTQTASVHTIQAHIKTLERNMGFVPDVVFIDYADIMKPTEKFDAKRDTLTHLYESLRALAIEFNIPVWTASQTNKGGINSERFGIDVIGESMGKAATADVIIGVGRTNEDKEANPPAATIGIIKNRTGQDGIYLSAIFDTAYVRIEVVDNTIGIPPQAMIGLPQINNNQGVIHERTYSSPNDNSIDGLSRLLENKLNEASRDGA